MYVITGVTGKLGRVAVEDLLTRVPAAEVAAVARDPRKAADLAEGGVDVRRGDYEDPASLRAAFTGADVLLLVSSPDITPGARARQHGNAIDAAVAAGVGRVVYTSAIGAENGQGFLADHTVTEELLAGSGLPHTVLRNTFYTEVLVNPGLRAAVDAGELLGADNGVPVNLATIADLGVAASVAVAGDGHEGAVYELRGPVWTLADLAQTVSEVSGKDVTYRPAPVEELGQAGFVHQLIASGLFSEPADDLEKLIGRAPTGLREAVETALRD
ncbi:NAD(P)H dehydrogenase (quinone) [Pseudonocardia hierapolitana]|uniref:NAD(P)H dehydrogenase (Quinone) n=1 Tax=Pseudonocardia hierapolitana TaxID=1128676 RepID=A0A561SSI3_9PSEU|nr:NAD(P)H-binding protein [Pseudonocardia hierapolitana]TWF77811.1 NAD(P)H dehydrogenase (quinone) [Pseudonocardia hierapolitana]